MFESFLIYLSLYKWAYPSEQVSPPEFLGKTTELVLATDYISISEGYWGDWSEAMDGPKNFLACGLALRDENGQSAFGDDSATNAIRIIYCRIDSWMEQQEINLNEGLWGNWKEKVMCPKDFFIYGVQAKVEKPQGSGDDTALNGLRAKCRHPKLKTAIATLSLEYGGWGDWGNWVEYPTSYICGGQIRFEEAQGGGDDSALNGVRFRFCKYVELKSVKFRYSTAQAERSPVPEVIKSTTFVNKTPLEQKSIFEVSEKRSSTQSWQNTQELTIGLTVKTEAQVPLIGKSEVEVTTQGRFEWTSGKEISEEKTFTSRQEMAVPACSDLIASFVSTKDTVNVPYEADLVFVDGSKETISGIWNGVAFFNEHIEVETHKRNYC